MAAAATTATRAGEDAAGSRWRAYAHHPKAANSGAPVAAVDPTTTARSTQRA
jgi:hypothetical protein